MRSSEFDPDTEFPVIATMAEQVEIIAGAAGWWQEIIGPGLAIDTNTWFVVVPNMLGGCQGSTGPASFAPDGSEWGARFPFTTVRDQVRAQVLLADNLGIDSWAAILGGSMGGMHALE